MSDHTVRIAAVQMRMGSPAENLEKHVAFIRKAAAERARIVLFPELAVGDGAEPLAGPAITRLRQAAREAGIFAVPCFMEQRDDGRYVSAPLISPNGEIVGVYRKTHAWPEWDHKVGDTYPVFDLGFAKIGIMICFDKRFPEVARLLAVQGADIILTPNSSDARGERWEPWSEPEVFRMYHQMRALENGVYVAATNKIGPVQDTECYGGSCICNPTGRIVADADVSEGLIMHDCDLDLVRQVREYRLCNRRPSSYAGLTTPGSY
ncbi:MAG TPA: carbon-nitrogen hydrolase family protein [Symbiobacteriaceae bacterium]|nr:carbon-nitrogen hydrolase family protein [Symbiobacteriaceae bacterium]